jgi:hypothetical protein
MLWVWPKRDTPIVALGKTGTSQGGPFIGKGKGVGGERYTPYILHVGDPRDLNKYVETFIRTP